MPTDDTLFVRPMPKRPRFGLLAWQATIGYLSLQYSLDARLTLHARPLETGDIAWSGTAWWGQNHESVQGCASLPAVLDELWQQVSRSHIIFETREALLRRPAGYAAHEWLDADTAAILNRLVHITQLVYASSWQLIVNYEPVESPPARFQIRLLVAGEADGVDVNGEGANLRDACHALYRAAAPYYVTRSGKALAELD